MKEIWRASVSTTHLRWENGEDTAKSTRSFRTSINGLETSFEEQIMWESRKDLFAAE